MRWKTGFSIVVVAFSWTTAPASADPVSFHPEGCDFELRFPAAPVASEVKTQTSRGDTVINNKATLSLEIDGKPNYFRAECVGVPRMGFVDDAILAENMRALGITYNLQNASAGVDHNRVAGPVGWLRGRGRVGGQDMMFEIRRFTSRTDIFDVWIGTAPDSFPSGANTAFLKSIKLDGQDVP